MSDTRRPQGRRFADAPPQPKYGNPQQYQQQQQSYQAPRRQQLTCGRCGSNNVTVSVDHTAVQRKKNGCLYWIFIGWWYHFFYWLCFKLWLNLWRRITNKGSKAIVYSEHKTAICQDCGNSWKL